jgi:hypothetical protein
VIVSHWRATDDVDHTGAVMDCQRSSDCRGDSPVPKMVVMIRNGLAVALCAAACGEVDRTPADAAVVDAAPPPRAYRGTMDMVPTVTFGGLPFCTYTITLKQLQVELGILPSGLVASGQVQDLNVEAVIPSTMPNCPADLEVIPPNIATYAMQSVMPSPTGQTLTFKGGAGNMPPVDLTLELSTVGSAYQAKLGFHRNNVAPPLDWSVIATVSLSLQPSS